MRNSKRPTFTSQSTIYTQMQEINSNFNIIPTTLLKDLSSSNIKNNGRYTSILKQFYDQSQSSGYFQQPLNILNKITISQKIVHRQIDLIFCLQKIFFKKKRYCFQILKQFILFPDQSQSSMMSISKYDPLIFQDQILHTLNKILQTKVIQNKIWGFINLRLHNYQKAVYVICQKLEVYQARKNRIYKKQSFQVIKNNSFQKFKQNESRKALGHFSATIPSMYVSGQKCKQENNIKKSIQKNNLNSRIISQKVYPTFTSTSKQIRSQPLSQELKTRIVRINASQNYYTPSATRIYSSIDDYYKKNQLNYPKFQEQPKITIKTPQDMNKQQQKQKANKFNIIHYYQRSKQQQRFNSGQLTCQNKCFYQNYYQYSCCPTICNCYISCNICCCQITNNFDQNNLNYQKHNSFMNTTVYSYPNIQKCKSNHQGKEKGKIPKKELQELESRIQYLNFLKKYTTEQKSS